MVAVSVIWVRFRVGLSWLGLGFVFGTGVRLRTELVLRLGLGFWLGLGTGGRMMSAIVIFLGGQVPGEMLGCGGKCAAFWPITQQRSFVVAENGHAVSERSRRRRRHCHFLSVACAN